MAALQTLTPQMQFELIANIRVVVGDDYEIVVRHKSARCSRAAISEIRQNLSVPAVRHGDLKAGNEI